jgi:hypothetical protein
MRYLKCFVCVCLFSVETGIWPALQSAQAYGKEDSTWYLNGREIRLDRNIWTYAAPGTLEHSSRFPLGKTGGLLIKYPENEKKRIVTVIRSDPMTSFSKTLCKKIASRSPASAIRAGRKSCTVTIRNQATHQSEIHWVMEDLKNLKLVSFATVIPNARVQEIKKDLDQIQKDFER